MYLSALFQLPIRTNNIFEGNREVKIAGKDDKKEATSDNGTRVGEPRKLLLASTLHGYILR
jgi:hypothetical protein